MQVYEVRASTGDIDDLGACGGSGGGNPAMPPELFQLTVAAEKGTNNGLVVNLLNNAARRRIFQASTSGIQ